MVSIENLGNPQKTTPDESPFRCLKCSQAISFADIQERICPILDSMGSSLAWLSCPCGYTAQFLAPYREGATPITQIVIVGMPGPDYEVIAEAAFQPTKPYFGWFLKDESETFWVRARWDVYLRNWIGRGLNDFCAKVGLITAEKATDKDWLSMMSFNILMFQKTYYDEPFAKPLPEENRITLGTAPQNIEGMIAAAMELYQTGREAYFGKTLNQSWLQKEYVDLIEKIAKFAAYLPKQEESKPAKPETGVILGSFRFAEGIQFISGGDRKYFLLGKWEKLPLGTQNLARNFFGENDLPGTFRILVHTGDCWSTWLSFGPFEKGVLEAELAKVREQFPVQRQIAPGVYEGRGSCMNKIEIYNGRNLVREIHLLKDAHGA